MARKIRVGNDTDALDRLISSGSKLIRFGNWYRAFPDSPFFSNLISGSIIKRLRSSRGMSLQTDSDRIIAIANKTDISAAAAEAAVRQAAAQAQANPYAAKKVTKKKPARVLYRYINVGSDIALTEDIIVYLGDLSIPEVYESLLFSDKFKFTEIEVEDTLILYDRFRFIEIEIDEALTLSEKLSIGGLQLELSELLRLSDIIELDRYLLADENIKLSDWTACNKDVLASAVENISIEALPTAFTLNRLIRNAYDSMGLSDEKYLFKDEPIINEYESIGLESLPTAFTLNRLIRNAYEAIKLSDTADVHQEYLSPETVFSSIGIASEIDKIYQEILFVDKYDSIKIIDTLTDIHPDYLAIERSNSIGIGFEKIDAHLDSVRIPDKYESIIPSSAIKDMAVSGSAPLYIGKNKDKYENAKLSTDIEVTRNLEPISGNWITNWDFESTLTGSGWTGHTCAGATTTLSRVSTGQFEGKYSLEAIGSSTQYKAQLYQRIDQTFTKGKTYRQSFWYKTNSTNPTGKDKMGFALAGDNDDLTLCLIQFTGNQIEVVDEWTFATHDITLGGSGSYSYLYWCIGLYVDTIGIYPTFYLDGVCVKEL